MHANGHFLGRADHDRADILSLSPTLIVIDIQTSEGETY